MSEGAGSARSEWQRRKDLDRIFGETEPATTSDEREPGQAAGASKDAGESATDRWLREQVPPHHGCDGT